MITSKTRSRVRRTTRNSLALSKMAISKLALCALSSAAVVAIVSAHAGMIIPTYESRVLREKEGVGLTCFNAQLEESVGVSEHLPA